LLLLTTSIETGKSKLFVSTRVAVTTVGARDLISAAKAKDDANKDRTSNRIYICICEAVY
jgi:hypothetical protein